MSMRSLLFKLFKEKNSLKVDLTTQNNIKYLCFKVNFSRKKQLF